MKDTKKLNHGAVKMVAHRGVSGLEKENSNAAFIAAGNRSYVGIETDVHVTADGKFVIIHDEETKRVAGEATNVNVEKCNFADLKEIRLIDSALQAPRSDLTLPSLKEYVSICKAYGKIAVLELKNKMVPEALAGIVAEIEEMEYLDGTIFISFSWDNLVEIKKMKPQQKVQFLTGQCDDELIDRMAANGFDLDIYYPSVTAELVEKLHQRGLEINCWTCDSIEDGEKLVSYGVDYISSNILE